MKTITASGLHGNSFSGFMLLEVLPSLLVLMAVMLHGIRIIQAGMDQHQMKTFLHQRDEAFEVVWNHWEHSGTAAAITHLDFTGGIEVWEVPDTSWLPHFMKGIPGSPTSVVYWKRTLSGEGGDQPIWSIEYSRFPDSTWQWYAGILTSDPFPR